MANAIAQDPVRLRVLLIEFLLWADGKSQYMAGVSENGMQYLLDWQCGWRNLWRSF
jgi:hypothetical protein